MRRAVILLASVSLVLVSWQGGFLHVHDAGGFGDSDHRHGPAAHSHLDVRPVGGVFIEEFDSTGPLRTVLFISVAPGGAVFAAVPAAVPSVGPAPVTGAASNAPDDVRVHGPPLTSVGLRAPPFFPAS